MTQEKITRNLNIQDKITRNYMIQEKTTRNLDIQDKITRTSFIQDNGDGSDNGWAAATLTAIFLPGLLGKCRRFVILN